MKQQQEHSNTIVTCHQKVIVQLEASSHSSAAQLIALKHALSQNLIIDRVEIEQDVGHIIIYGVFSQQAVQMALTRFSDLSKECTILLAVPLQLPKKEMVYHIPEMMCMGNCGLTITRALHDLCGVEKVSITFETRLVIVRGHILPHWVAATCEAIGFQATLTSVLCLPTAYYVQLSKDMVSLNETQKTDVEVSLSMHAGIEKVTWTDEEVPANELCILLSTLSEARILLAIQSLGMEGQRVLKPECHAQKEDHHVCTDECSTLECEQYRATLAHSAALAAGWVVPGCAMSWGGECNCGDDCKCAGCPTHNPKAEVL